MEACWSFAGLWLMSRTRAWPLALAAWVSALVALLPTAAAIAVAIAAEQVGWAPAVGLGSLVVAVSALLLFRRGRVLLGLVPAALVVLAAGLPEESRELLSDRAPGLVALIGLLAMAVAILVLERPASSETLWASAASRAYRRSFHERMRAVAAVAALPVPAALVLWLTPDDETPRRLLSFAAVAFVWALVYYTLFAAPALNQEYDISRVEIDSRDPKIRRNVMLRAAAVSVLGVAAFVLAVYLRV